MRSLLREAGSVRIVLMGLGAINRRVVTLLRSRHAPTRIVGVVVRHPDSLPPELVGDAALIRGPADLIALRPDMILEAASREAVKEWGEVSLRAARQFVVSSASALTDDALLHRLREEAKRSGSQLVVSPGALAGMDALSAAARLGIREVRHRIVKPPRSWGASKENVPDISKLTVLFHGSAREAAQGYPLNANVTVVSGLSGLGLDATIVELISDPSATGNRHEIRALGDFGSLTVTLENRPLLANPRSSELAALALVRLAENAASDLVV